MWVDEYRTGSGSDWVVGGGASNIQKSNFMASVRLGYTQRTPWHL